MDIRSIGIVLTAHDDTLTILWECRQLSCALPSNLADIQPAEWVAFIIDESSKKPRDLLRIAPRWKSRLNHDGELTVEVNATIRDEREFPGDYPDGKPWSFELDFLEDPHSRMCPRRQVYPGVMYSVTASLVSNRCDLEGRRIFQVVSVEDESHTLMQMELTSAPWFTDSIKKATIARGGAQSLINRDISKTNRNTGFMGILLRQREDRGIEYNNRRFPVQTSDRLTFWVWSLETGLIVVGDFPDRIVDLDVGDWVTFRTTTKNDSLRARNLKRARTAPLESYCERERMMTEARVIVEVAIPENIAEETTTKFTVDDQYLGSINIRKLTLNRLLEQTEYCLDDVAGYTINLVMKPSRGNRDGNLTWELCAINEEVFVEEKTAVEELAEQVQDLIHL